MMPKVGDRVAGYTLLALIARGGMSTVFRAHDERLDRDVALKLLSAELSEDPAFRSRFEREWRVAAGLRHPNIVPVFDAGEWEEQLYIAMQLVEGPDLARVIERAGPLPATRALAIITQLAAALDAAHAQGIVHRDVKPGNVLLLEGQGPGGSDHVYLADFGLTRRTSSMSRMTRTGSFLGTLGYIAPEQLKGLPVDARTDEYSLACVAYEMLTSGPPFARDSEVAMITAHLHDPPPAVSLKRGDLPAGLDAIIARGMAKDPAERYQSCGDFARAFAAGLHGEAQPTLMAPLATAYGEPTLLRPTPPPQHYQGPGIVFGPVHTASQSRSGPPLLVVGIVVLLVLLLGGVGALFAQRLLGGTGTATPTSPVTGVVPSGTATAAATAALAATPTDVALASPAGPTQTLDVPTQAPTPRPTPRPTATRVTPGPTATPAPLTSRERLLAVIPSAMQPQCHNTTSHDTSISGYVAVLQCDVNTSQVLYVRYWLYPDVGNLDDQWARRMAALGATGLPVGSGNCWAGEEGQTTHARGSLQCDIYPTDNSLELRWSDRADLVYAAVSGNPGDLASLVQWWSVNAVRGGTSP